MQVKHKIIKNLPLLLILILTFETFSLIGLKQNAKAAALLGGNDYISNDQVNATNVNHNVSFVIPLNGHTIVPTDYIRIILPNFSAVTAPTSISGVGGVPTFGVNGNIAYVTGVTAGPGDGIGISGITATNPANPLNFDFIVQLTNNLAGTIVYDSTSDDVIAYKGVTTVSVRILADTSSIELFGYTSPKAFVTILLDGAVSATDIATNQGNFHKKITGLTPNHNYSISIFAQDKKLRDSRTVSFVILTIPGNNTIISNIVIPTTIDTDKKVINTGDIIRMDGFSHPLSQVTVFVNSKSYTDVVSSNNNGYWEYYFDTFKKPVGGGDHVTYAKEVVVGGYESIFSKDVDFHVNPCGIADLNCDGSVNLTDFSILMFYWGQALPANPRADINNDQDVNLVDFSIMLFYWTG